MLSMQTLDEVNAEIKRLQDIRLEMEATHFREVVLPRMQALIGKTYKYRNCFSCPQNEEDYWWLYTKITGIKEQDLVCIKIQKDAYGNVSAETGCFSESKDYLPITKEEYDRETKKLLDEIALMTKQYSRTEWEFQVFKIGSIKTLCAAYKAEHNFEDDEDPSATTELISECEAIYTELMDALGPPPEYPPQQSPNTNIPF